MPESTSARKAAELTGIPLEHFLCAQSIYHTLALMNPEDVLRPSHYGMLSESVDALKPIVLGPEDEEDDHDPFDDDEIKPHAEQPQPVAVNSAGFGERFVEFLRGVGGRGETGA